MCGVAPNLVVCPHGACPGNTLDCPVYAGGICPDMANPYPACLKPVKVLFKGLTQQQKDAGAKSLELKSLPCLEMPDHMILSNTFLGLTDGSYRATQASEKKRALELDNTDYRITEAIAKKL